MSESNIENAIRKILFDEQNLVEFFTCEDQNGLYRYCSSKYSGYTKEEFDEFIKKTTQKSEFIKQKFDDFISKTVEKVDTEIKNVSSPKIYKKIRQVFSKAIAIGLAALTVTPMVQNFVPGAAYATAQKEKNDKDDKKKTLKIKKDNVRKNSKKIQTSKKIIKEESFMEEHAVLMKVLKYSGIATGILAAFSALNYGAGFVLDKINPECVLERDRKSKMNATIKGLAEDILNLRAQDPRMENSSIQNEIEGKRKEIYNLNSELKLANSPGILENHVFSLTGISGMFTILGYVADLVNSAGEFGRNVMRISYLKWAMENLANTYKEIAQFFKSPPRSANKEKALENFDQLSENYYGQNEAIAVVKSHLYDIVIAKDQAKWKNKNIHVAI